jgi:GTP pyrophosphokinase
MSTVNDAIRFAAERHAGQVRKRTQQGVALPYVVHPIEVLKLIWKWGTVDEVTAQAAVLHDVVEDTGLSLPALATEFGPHVTGVVGELSYDPAMWKDKDEYLRSFARPELTSVRALVIKLADRLCNVSDFMMHDPAYAVTYFGKAAALGDALGLRKEEIAREWGEQPLRNVETAWENMLWTMHG